MTTTNELDYGQMQQMAEARERRAWELKLLREEDERARTSLAGLEQRLATDVPGFKEMEEIHRLAEAIPAGLVTRGGQFMPGGFSLAHIVRGEIGHALNKMVADREALRKSLPAAQKRVADMAARLKAFNETR